MNEYQVVNGTSYHKDTEQNIIDILERVRSRGQRIVLDYGDLKTGQSWGEIHDIAGTLGRSMGPCKVPILLYNSRSIGGGAILDHCIVKITASQGGHVIYKHPKYRPAYPGPEQYTCIVLSTAHMIEQDSKLLNSEDYITRCSVGSISGGMIMARDTGFFVKLYEDLGLNNRPALSDGFNNAIKYAHAKGARLVEFDCAGPLNPELEIFDW